jgi:hypothetical protein
MSGRYFASPLGTLEDTEFGALNVDLHEWKVTDYLKRFDFVERRYCDIGLAHRVYGLVIAYVQRTKCSALIQIEARRSRVVRQRDLMQTDPWIALLQGDKVGFKIR